MKLFTSALLLAAITWFSSCKSSSGSTETLFCDTTCNNDTIRYEMDLPSKPFVMITMKDCEPDSITWGHDRLENYRQLKFADLAGKYVRVNRDFINFTIEGTSHVWITFNECINGQGYMIKVPFDQSENIFRKNSAFNNIDPKYFVDESLVAYTDRGNVFVEDKATGKKATMTFGVQTEMEYAAMHETVDSIHITPTRVWARVMIDKKWKEMEKEIVLE